MRKIPVQTQIPTIYEGGSIGHPVPFTQYIQVPCCDNSTVRACLAIPVGKSALLKLESKPCKSAIVNKLPVLSDIPYLSCLFTYRTEDSDTEHTLMLLTAKFEMVSDMVRPAPVSSNLRFNAVGVPSRIITEPVPLQPPVIECVRALLPAATSASPPVPSGMTEFRIFATAPCLPQLAVAPLPPPLTTPTPLPNALMAAQYPVPVQPFHAELCQAAACTPPLMPHATCCLGPAPVALTPAMNSAPVTHAEPTPVPPPMMKPAGTICRALFGRARESGSADAGEDRPLRWQCDDEYSQRRAA